MRIRDKWKDSNPKSIEEQATALAYIIWQLGLNYTKNLHQEEFDLDSDQQRLDVIAEYMVYLSHMGDRYCHQSFDDTQRQQFMNCLVADTARHLQRNSEEVLGSGDYRSQYIDLANRRFEQYANCEFEDSLPGYSARRLLANEIQTLMGNSQTNKWVIQQVLDIDSLEASEQLMKSMKKLLQ